MVSNDYIVGLTDGEGCFYVNVRPKRTPRSKQSPVETHFYIKLREDQLPILQEVQKVLGCGGIYYQKDKRENHAGCYRYEINAQRDIHGVLIPFLDSHPLIGPKRRDYQIFKTIARMVLDKAHLTDEGLEKIRHLKAQMNQGARWMREIRSSSGNANKRTKVSQSARQASRVGDT